MTKNINIRIEGGFLQISGQIPVASAGDELESFVRELKFQLFGEEDIKRDGSPNRVPKDLNEKDAAGYIGRSVSFLRMRRYNGKHNNAGGGPKYTRESERCIRYPVKELDKWLESRHLFRACCEENNCDVTPKVGLYILKTS
ncbi:hypothetical protein FACS1894187_17000 [Synergistales bacterium]|nr:hypothetical protein FACS1894187_17000 [Synergistales bacterium]